TRLRLLEAGGEIFANGGFEPATVRDICIRAGANVASVNYHFGGKFALYRACIEHWLHVARDRFPMDDEIARARSPRAKLEAFVRVFLNRLLDPGKPAWHAQLMMREFSSPTGVLEEVCDRQFIPVMTALRSIVREIAGPGTPSITIDRCIISIISQCTACHEKRRVMGRVFENVERIVDINELSAHITAFSYAGIRAAREVEVKKPTKPTKSTKPSIRRRK
ncbi:MAG TPA: CerR family C-terminal domain-containing protein, partial [Tepidisphaeraceae bacterium]|nr:CerR family C-terminal domain-containing protein [Tepidisphaeraceae bacterium]